MKYKEEIFYSLNNGENLKINNVIINLSQFYKDKKEEEKLDDLRGAFI